MRVMKVNMLVTVAAAAMLGFGAMGAGAEEAKSVDMYYFGNSFTGSTAPMLHEKLAASAGRTWTNVANMGPGWPIWFHLYNLRQGTKGDMNLVNGEWTLNPEFKPKNPRAGSFYKKKWDAIMLQPFGWKLETEPLTEAWEGKAKFDKPTDIGDVQSAVDIMKIYLDTVNADGAVYIFQSWPGNSLGRSALAARGKELNDRQMEPIRRSYDFERDWFKRYDPDASPWAGGGCASRDYEYRLMDALIERYPALWKAGRLRLMPVVDVWSLLDRQARAGRIKGLENIGQFHADSGHGRCGLPAYVAAATFYTVIFGSRPHDLDYTIFNDRAAYGKDLFHDWGNLFEITPELARAASDAIWAVVQAHPYAGFGGSREKLSALEATVSIPEPVRVLEVGSAPGPVARKSACALPCWQPWVDRLGGKWSQWQVVRKGWYGMGRYAAELQKGGQQLLHKQLLDKDWPTARLDRLILQPLGASDAEVDGTAWLAKMFLEGHPEGRVLLYFTWPDLPAAVALREKREIPTWQPILEEKMAPLRAAFDYSAAWNAKEAADGTATCMEVVTAKVKAKLGDQAGRVDVIPAGALLAALDEKLKAGALPGVKSVSAFYKDGTMLRTGLPRYALAALRFAAVHGADPAALDASLFNEPKLYPPDDLDPKTPKGQLKVTVKDDEFDNGPHFPITDEGKKLVDETVRALVGK
jgi:hypothetical protein